MSHISKPEAARRISEASKLISRAAELIPDMTGASFADYRTHLPAYQEREALLKEAAIILRTTPSGIADKIRELQAIIDSDEQESVMVYEDVPIGSITLRLGMVVPSGQERDARQIMAGLLG